MSASVLLTACQQMQTSKPAAAAAPAAASASAAEIVIDNGDPGFKSQGNWATAGGGHDHKDSATYASSTSAGDAANTATWTPEIRSAGLYDVYEWHGDDPNSDHASNAPFTVKSDDGTKTIMVNLRNNTGKWNLLGTFNFAAGKADYVSVSSRNADGNVLADAVRFFPHP